MARFRPTLRDVGQSWPNVGQTWFRFDREWGPRMWPRLVRLRPKLVGLRANSAGVDRSVGLCSTEVGPDPATFGPQLTNFGSVPAKLVRVRPNLPRQRGMACGLEENERSTPCPSPAWAAAALKADDPMHCPDIIGDGAAMPWAAAIAWDAAPPMSCGDWFQDPLLGCREPIGSMGCGEPTGCHGPMGCGVPMGCHGPMGCGDPVAVGEPMGCGESRPDSGGYPRYPRPQPKSAQAKRNIVRSGVLSALFRAEIGLIQLRIQP